MAWPRSARSAAATAESTPPLIAASTRGLGAPEGGGDVEVPFAATQLRDSGRPPQDPASGEAADPASDLRPIAAKGTSTSPPPTGARPCLTRPSLRLRCRRRARHARSL